jgi:hypothetical protein
VSGTDDLGNSIKTEVTVRAVTWKQYRVTNQEPIKVRIPGTRPFTGALAMELVADGKRIAANYVNLVARPPEGTSARVEVVDRRRIAIRFRPDEVQDFDWGSYIRTALFPGKFSAPGAGSARYRIALPEFVREAGPVRLELVAEVASKAVNEKRDWGPKPRERTDPSYPQTDRKKHRGVVQVSLAGEKLEPFELPDDPADARGVLSSLAGIHHASYGYLMRKALNLTSGSAGGHIDVRFEVPAGKAAGGLAIYGERMGQYLIDPTLFVYTSKDVKYPVGWTSGESAAITDPSVR